MSSKADFYNSVYTTAKQLGATDVQAHLAASQASLETGYGKHVAGNNYFGIKASPSWSGDSVATGTSEDTAGGMVNITDNFRAYDGLTSSVANYMDVMSRNFSDAWNAPTLADAVSNLSEGKYGAYATDRNYENKISKIANGFADTVGSWFDNVPTPTPGPNTDAETAAAMAPAPGLIDGIGQTAGRLSRGILGFASDAANTATNAFNSALPSMSLVDKSGFPPAPALDAANSNLAQGLLAQRDYVAPQQAMASADPTQQDRTTQMADRLAAYSAMPAATATPFDSVLAPQTNVATQSNILSAYESNPATPTNADPMMAAAEGPYTANNLTNSLATSPQALGIVPNPTTTTPATGPAISSAFQSNGLLKGIPNQTLGAYNTNVTGTQYGLLDQAKVSNVTPGIAPPAYDPANVPAQPSISPAVTVSASVPKVDVPQATATVPSIQQKPAGFLADLGITKQGLAGGLLGGLTLGPAGGLIGSLIGNYIAKNPGAMGNFGLTDMSNYTRNNLGSGAAAFQGVYGPGAKVGNTFTANNGATVSLRPDGNYDVTTPSGQHEVHSPDGSVSAAW